ncbi:hypothetical protein ACHQM5_003746 [Ranunculus cassubicifolius]
MAGGEIEEIPMLSYGQAQSSGEATDTDQKRRATRTWRSMSIPMYTYDDEDRFASQNGVLRARKTLLTQMSGPLRVSQKSGDHILPVEGSKSYTSLTLDGEIRRIDDNETAANNVHLSRVSNDQHGTTCPTNDNVESAKEMNSSSKFHHKLHNIHSIDTEGWSRTFYSFLGSCVPGIISPHATVVQKWNKVFTISLMGALFVDPLFVFLLSVDEEFKCINFDFPLGRTMAVFRSITDCLYLLHMLLQFRLAYVDPGSRAVGIGELVDQPKKIFLRYLYGYFSMDVLAVFPLLQIILFGGLSSGYNFMNSWLEPILVLQSGLRLYRFTLLVITGNSLSEFMRETASGNYLLNICFCGMSAQLVGSYWYLFGIQRIKECLRNVCAMSKLRCTTFIQCGSGKNNVRANFENNWRDVSSYCFEENLFNYGIYEGVIELSYNHFLTKWTYSFFWGFQQISTMAGNQTPSYYIWEILFSIWIVGIGLIYFAILVGNMQSFIQALGRRRLDIKLKHMDIEQWMRRRRLPEELRREVRQSERFHYDATDGVKEESLLENLPENLRREIRRHRFSFIKKVRIFAQMDDQILDAICERLKQNLCIKGSKIFYSGGVIDKMHFIVWGKMISVDTNGNRSLLSEGDVCGEELLTCCLDHYAEREAGGKLCVSRYYLPSNRTVTCLTDVEAFSLQFTDLDEVTTLFPGFLRSSRVQGALRYESPYWRVLAATRIQIAWRYRKKRLTRAKPSNPGTSCASR